MDNDSKILNLAAAMQFRPTPHRNGVDLDISEYRCATPDALKYLLTQGYDAFVIIGLERLDNENASLLSQFDAFLWFTRLEYLDAKIAAILVGSGNSLEFQYPIDISVDVAKELAKSTNQLNLFLNEITVSVAMELVAQKHEMSLDLGVPPSEKILGILCGHAGYRLSIHWKSPPNVGPCTFLSSAENKKVFVVPRYCEETSLWFENIYIGDVDFYPDTLEPKDGVIFVP